MSSTTVLSPSYSDRNPALAAGNWLTYACVPAADLAALLLTAVLSELLRYLIFGRFASTDYHAFCALRSDRLWQFLQWPGYIQGFRSIRSKNFA